MLNDYAKPVFKEHSCKTVIFLEVLTQKKTKYADLAGN